MSSTEMAKHYAKDLTEFGTDPNCSKCDDCGGEETYKNQVMMPIRGKVVCIDHCIHNIIAALNAANIETVACCCGHGKQNGSILLLDGRELVIRRWSGE